MRPLSLADPTGLICESGEGILIAYGDTVPTDASTGYAPGCIFLKTNGSTHSTIVYANIGTKASSNFDAMHVVPTGAALTTALTTITIADAAGTPDYALQALTTSSPYGLATAAEAISVLYVIKNLQTRVNELEARLQAAGIIA